MNFARATQFHSNHCSANFARVQMGGYTTTNAYSDLWFKPFISLQDEASTQLDVNFLVLQLPPFRVIDAFSIWAAGMAGMLFHW